MKGSYALVLHLPADTKLTVGKLGSFSFSDGYYLYFGSALNSLEGRLRRHLTQGKKQHWHIDRLTDVAQIVQIWWTVDNKKTECTWTQRSLEKGNTSVPVLKFGSSDCRACPAHLVHAPSWNEVQQVRWQLEMDYPDGGLHVSDDVSNGFLQPPENPDS